MPYKDKARQLAYQNAWLKRRRLEWLKANGPCRSCGAPDNLEVDHVDPATKTSHRIWSLTKAKRELELAKCQPLCRSCHREKTRAYLSVLNRRAA